MDSASSTAKGLRLQPVVFLGSTALIFGVLGFSVLAPERVETVASALQAGIVARFGWLYILSMTAFVAVALWLMVSRFGAIRLGPDDARPDFGTPTWLAMLFSAGMGIGLLFYSVAEPMMHYQAFPDGRPPSPATARDAMGLTFFHWGFHPWALYTLFAICLGYFGYRRGLPLSPRSALYPLVGERIHGPIGHAVDMLAVVSTLFGVATSLGLGAMQINAGFAHVFGIAQGTTAQVVIIAVITAFATVSVVSGLHVGIRRLSELNMGIAGLLLLYVLLAGPTFYLFGTLVDGLGAYAQQLLSRSLWTATLASPEEQSWLGSWTVFYWGWWIAWAPFVGMFIARISRGRTIREVVAGVMIAPSLLGFLWLAIFGGAALEIELKGSGGLAAAVSENVATAVFALLEHFPLSGVTSVLCTLCVVLFFVTSSDSASLVVDTIASGGHPDPPVAQRVYWAVLEGVVATVLLFAGGLKALQTASITAALPFCLVIIAMVVGLLRSLADEIEAT